MVSISNTMPKVQVNTDPITFSTLGSRAKPAIIADLMHTALSTPGLLSLAAGFTDNESLPTDFISSAVAALREQGTHEHLQYGSNQGRPGLIEALTELINQYPEEKALSPFSTEQALITNGSQQALYLAMQTLCDAGDIVLVEEPSYFVYLEMLNGLGIEAVPLPTLGQEAGAVDFLKLDQLLHQMKDEGRLSKIRAIYLEGYYNNPSTQSLSLNTKVTIAQTLTDHQLIIPVIEDAAYRELFFTQQHAVPSVFSIPEFTAFPKLYLGTLTKPFATGLKIGYGYCSHPEWRSKMLAIKGHQDFGSAHFNQAILEHALKNGSYQQHLAYIRKHYSQKAKTMSETLEASRLRKLGWHWETPEGGLYFWLRGPNNMDTSMDSQLCRSCIEAGVLYVPGDLCMSTLEKKNCIRLSFGAIPLKQLKEATQRFISVVEAI